ncbi:MAG: hypothetical protein K6E71_10355 [Lachnospiraceae bacterium]|nr:hypothetical protein [Lachnospiraceae bacterium]
MSHAIWFYSDILAVLMMHIAAAAAVGVPLTLILSRGSASEAWKMKYLFLHFPLMIGIALTAETLLRIRDLYRAKGKNYSALVFVFLSFVTGAFSLTLRRFMQTFAGQGQEIRQSLFPWAYRYVFDEASGHAGLCRAECVWIAKGVLVCLAALLVWALLYPVFQREKGTAEKEKKTVGERIILASAMFLFVFFAYWISTFYMPWSYLGFATCLLFVYIAVYYLFSDRFPQSDWKELLRIIAGYGVTTAVMLAFLFVMYMTNGFGLGKRVPSGDLSGMNLCIELRSSDKNEPCRLFFAGSHSIMYYPKGDRDSASVITAEGTRDSALREIARVFQNAVAGRKRTVGSFFEFLENGNSVTAQVYALLYDEGGDSAPDTSVYMRIYRPGNPEFLDDQYKEGENGIEEQEFEKQYSCLEQVGNLTEEELKKLAEELRRLGSLTEKEGVAFRYFWYAGQ